MEQGVSFKFVEDNSKDGTSNVKLKYNRNNNFNYYKK